MATQAPLVDRFWTIPNILCFVRIGLAFAFLIYGLQGEWVWALAAFGIAAVTDMVDGTVARFLRQRSRFGAFIDPMADKLLLFFSFIVLMARGYLPWPLFAVVVLRDLIITVGTLTFLGKGWDFEFAPSLLSKLNTLVQILVVAFSLVSVGVERLSWQGAWARLALAGLPYLIALCYATTAASGLQYIGIGWGILRRNRQGQNHAQAQARRQ